MADLDATPLYAMNPLSRFSDRAADYVKYRPSYPAAAIDQILAMGSPPQLVAADVGAGTGISARLLAERGVRVLAIEPNLEMRQVAEAHPLLEFRDAKAEATGLADASVDLVTCFQSFHWFEPHSTLSEFRRIIKPSGKLVLVWNYADAADKFTAKYMQLVDQAAKTKKFQSASTKQSRFAQFSSYLIKYREPLHFWHCLSLSNVINTLYGIKHKQELDLAGLIGLARSYSVISLDESGWQNLISDVQQLYESKCDRNGRVYLSYRTVLFIAKPKLISQRF